MNSQADLEARAEAVLKRIQRHNLGTDPLNASEVRSLLKETRAIGKLTLCSSLPDEVLALVDRTLQKAVQEISIVERALGHGPENRTN